MIIKTSLSHFVNDLVVVVQFFLIVYDLIRNSEIKVGIETEAVSCAQLSCIFHVLKHRMQI